MAHRTFQKRAYCTPAGYRRFDEVLSHVRTLGNVALQERHDAWKLVRKCISYLDQCRSLTLARHDDSASIEQLDIAIIRGALRRVDRALKTFVWRVRNGGKPGYLRARSRQRNVRLEKNDPSASQAQHGCSKVYIRANGLPTITLRPHRPLPSESPHDPRSSRGKRILCTICRARVQVARRTTGDPVHDFEKPVHRCSAHNGALQCTLGRIRYCVHDFLESQKGPGNTGFDTPPVAPIRTLCHTFDFGVSDPPRRGRSPAFFPCGKADRDPDTMRYPVHRFLRFTLLLAKAPSPERADRARHVNCRRHRVREHTRAAHTVARGPTLRQRDVACRPEVGQRRAATRTLPAATVIVEIERFTNAIGDLPEADNAL